MVRMANTSLFSEQRGMADDFQKWILGCVWDAVVRSEGEERDLHKKQRCKTIRTASKSFPGCFLIPWNRWTIMYNILNMAWVVAWIGWKSTELRCQLMSTRWEASLSPYKGYMQSLTYCPQKHLRPWSRILICKNCPSLLDFSFPKLLAAWFFLSEALDHLIFAMPP